MAVQSRLSLFQNSKSIFLAFVFLLVLFLVNYAGVWPFLDAEEPTEPSDISVFGGRAGFA